MFCIDEKTAIQALDRTDPVLPLSPGRAERHGFEYVRHGTLSLFAALDVATGRVQGMTAPRHTSANFLTFLDAVVADAPRGKALHFIVDNLSAHKTKAVRAWLAGHPRVTLHSPRPTAAGSIKWRAGSRGSSGTASRAASSRRRRCGASRCSTSMRITSPVSHWCGGIPTPRVASVLHASQQQSTRSSGLWRPAA